jgi:hypothetical protein
MELTIKAPAGPRGLLGEFWARYFPEVPTCTSGDCAEIATEVDPFFPYLDDLNRCSHHPTLGTLEPAIGSLS